MPNLPNQKEKIEFGTVHMAKTGRYEDLKKCNNHNNNYQYSYCSALSKQRLEVVSFFLMNAVSSIKLYKLVVPHSSFYGTKTTVKVVQRTYFVPKLFY